MKRYYLNAVEIPDCEELKDLHERIKQEADAEREINAWDEDDLPYPDAAGGAYTVDFPDEVGDDLSDEEYFATLFMERDLIGEEYNF